MRRYSIDSASFTKSVSNTVVIDNYGNSYVSGFTQANGPMKPTIIKYTNAGDLLWVRRDSTDLADIHTTMCIDKNAAIYVSGNNSGFFTVKYDSLGTKVSQTNDTNGSTPYSLRVDSNLNIYLTGLGRYSKMCTIKYSQPPIGIAPINYNIPKQFELFQNYPNPFNPITNIKYQISNNDFVQLIIYDILGNEVERLFNKLQKAGVYEVKWNATNYASGIYFYKIEAGTFVQTKKMVLIK